MDERQSEQRDRFRRVCQILQTILFVFPKGFLVSLMVISSAIDLLNSDLPYDGAALYVFWALLSVLAVTGVVLARKRRWASRFFFGLQLMSTAVLAVPVTTACLIFPYHHFNASLLPELLFYIALMDAPFIAYGLYRLYTLRRKKKTMPASEPADNG